MKNKVSRILGVGIALAAAVTVYAQTTGMRADVPFRFYAGADSMPAGDYQVSALARGGVASIETRNGSAFKLMTTFNVVGMRESEPARLVFHRYGDVYFLAEIWTGDKSHGYAIGSSAREKELANSGTARMLAEIRLAVPR